MYRTPSSKKIFVVSFLVPLFLTSVLFLVAWTLNNKGIEKRKWAESACAKANDRNWRPSNWGMESSRDICLNSVDVDEWPCTIGGVPFVCQDDDGDFNFHRTEPEEGSPWPWFKKETEMAALLQVVYIGDPSEEFFGR